MKLMLKNHMAQMPDTEDESVIVRHHLKFKVIPIFEGIDHI